VGGLFRSEVFELAPSLASQLPQGLRWFTNIGFTIKRCGRHLQISGAWTGPIAGKPAPTGIEVVHKY